MTRPVPARSYDIRIENLNPATDPHPLMVTVMDESGAEKASMVNPGESRRFILTAHDTIVLTPPMDEDGKDEESPFKPWGQDGEPVT